MTILKKRQINKMKHFEAVGKEKKKIFDEPEIIDVFSVLWISSSKNMTLVIKTGSF